MRKYSILVASFLFATLLDCTLCAAQNTRYFKADHVVAATYVKLAANGRYKIIDREHMGVLLTDEGRWRQDGDLLTFTPTNSKKTSYQATENKYQGKVSSIGKVTGGKKRVMSAAARARISKATKQRWAKFRAAKAKGKG